MSTPIELNTNKIIVSPNNSDEVYLTGGDELIKTSDAGFSFVSLGNPASGYRVLYLEIDLHATNVFYLGAQYKLWGSGTFFHKLFRSANAGKTWDELRTPSRSTNFGGVNPLGMTFVTVHPYMPNVIFLGTENGCYKSENKGKSWNLLDVCLLGKPSTCIAFNKKMIAIGTTDGVFASYDAGKKWTEVNSGLSSREIIQIFIHPKSTDLFLRTSNGIFRSCSSSEPEWLKTAWMEERE